MIRLEMYEQIFFFFFDLRSFLFPYITVFKGERCMANSQPQPLADLEDILPRTEMLHHMLLWPICTVEHL